MESIGTHSERLDAILAQATPLQRTHFFDLSARLEIQDPQRLEKFASVCKRSGFRLLNSLPETIEKNATEAAEKLAMSRSDYVDQAIKGGYLAMLGYPADTVKNRIVEMAKLFGVPEERAERAIRLRASMICHEPKDLLARAEAMSEHFGMSLQQAKKLGMDYPVTLTLTLERLTHNIDTLSELTGLERAKIVRAATIEGSIFSQTPENVNANLSAGAACMGMTLEEYLPLCLRRPTLFALTGERVQSNIEQSAELLHISRDDFIAMAKRSPELLTLKPETLAEKMQQTSGQLGVEPEKFMEGAKKYPPLIMLSPETVARHAGFVQRTYRAAGKEIDNTEIVSTMATRLGRSDAALIGRMLVAQKDLMPAGPKHILRQDNPRIQELVKGHYEGRLGDSPRKDVAITRTLQQLHRLGVISELPEGITPMDTGKGR